jgi:valyl-tRNA synthetase
VLDTWFSSALWPFSTLGWPALDSPALRKFYPASDLETGYDILFFWVARMMMFGLHFMGRPPFRRILLHGLVVDETGEKMSKVKGNVIDPLDLVYGTTFSAMATKTLPGAPEDEAIAKFKKAYPSAAAMGAGFPAFGADAVRFTLAGYPPSNKRIALAPKRIEGNRHFLNKIWNATRLALDLLGDFRWPEAHPPEQGRLRDTPTSARPSTKDSAPTTPRAFHNRWVRSRFAAAVAAANEGMESFRIDEAAGAAYHFFWDELCAWYLELVKPILRKQADGTFAHPDAVAETATTLAYVLEGSLRLMHPIMPFITEELWQRVPHPRSRHSSIAFGPYPTPDEERSARDLVVDARMEILQGVISAARTVRSEHSVDKAEGLQVRVRSNNPETLSFLREHADSFRFVVKTAGLPVFEAAGGAREAGWTMGVVPSGEGPIEVLVNLKGLVQPSEERARIERELKKIDKDLLAIDKKLGSPGFVDRAPKEVVEEARTQRQALVDARDRLMAALQLVAEL